MKDKRTELSENDLHIIDVYSKKNLTDTMPQFGNPDDELRNHTVWMSNTKNEKTNGFFIN